MSVEHPDQRRSCGASAGFVRCIWLLSGPPHAFKGNRTSTSVARTDPLDGLDALPKDGVDGEESETDTRTQDQHNDDQARRQVPRWGLLQLDNVIKEHGETERAKESDGARSCHTNPLTPLRLAGKA
jgi:hypothetical protein